MRRLRGPGLNWRLVLPITAAAAGTTSLGLAACAIYGYAHGDGSGDALAIPAAGGAVYAAVAFSSARLFRRIPLRARDAFLAVTLAWVVAATIGAVPYMIEGTLPRFVDAFFESMSGFTTTGSTLFPTIEDRPDGILLWRSATQWLGGSGIVVLVVAIAPSAGLAMQRIFNAETSGITDDRLTPRIRDTARIIYAIYLGFTAVGIAAFTLAGMSLFDAVNHTFTSVASGGFSTKNTSLLAFDSLAIELVAIVLMLTAAVNYAVYWRAVRGKSVRPQLAEVRAFALIVLPATAVVTGSLVVTDGGAFGQSLRDAAFSVASVISTTGFTTADFDGWNDVARTTLVLVMFVGGCAGSTAGGMKVVRVLLLARSTGQELGRQLRPKAVQVLRVGDHPLGEDVRRSVLAFALTFVLLVLAGTFVLLATGEDLTTASTAVIASITLVGPGLGEVGASENFTTLDATGRATTAFLMLVGRLELFAVLVLLTPVFWRRDAG